MRYKIKVLLLFLSCSMLFLAPVRGAIAQEKIAESAVQPTEIESVIQTLKNPVAREELIRQLNIMASAQQLAVPESQVKRRQAMS